MIATSKDLILLLGAGASVEADIPASALMIENLEKLLCNNEPLSRFRSLYQQVKSSIFYSAGLQGKFGGDVNYNIEVLVNTLWELERNELHPRERVLGKVVSLSNQVIEQAVRHKLNVGPH